MTSAFLKGWSRFGRKQDGDHAGAPPPPPYGLADDALHVHPGPLQHGGLHVCLLDERRGLSSAGTGLPCADVHDRRLRGHRRGRQRASIPPPGRARQSRGQRRGYERCFRLSSLLAGLSSFRPLFGPALHGLFHLRPVDHGLRRHLSLHRHLLFCGDHHAIRHRAHSAGQRRSFGTHDHPGHRRGAQPDP